KRPGYAVVATFTLALGIAANVAIFTVVNAILLQPLPYPDADRIVTVRHNAPGLALPELEISPGLVELYRDSASTLTRMAAYEPGERNLTGSGHPERIKVASVTPEVFDVLGVRPMRGRAFSEPDVRKDAPLVVILTDALWQSDFGSDPNVVGRRVEVNGVRAEIVGVMPAGFAFPDADTRLLVPLFLDPAGGFGAFRARGLARLAPGIALGVAQQEITALQTRIPERFPDIEREFLDRAGWVATVTPLRERVVGDVSTMLWILFATVGLVLLIAGANVANLFLVRAESRQREVAVRAALGAGRWRLIRAFLAESLLLTFAGGVAGAMLAWAAVRFLVASSPIDLPRLHEVRFDGTVLAFAVALSICAGLVLGALPMLQLAGRSFAALLHDGGRGHTASRARHRMRNLLIAGQVAMALLLLVASGLMLRSATRLYAVDPGIRVDDVIAAGISLGPRDRVQAVRLYQRMLDEVAGLPGVVAHGAANSLPVSVRSMRGGSFEIESRPRPDTEIPFVTMYMAVTPGFFETLGVPLLAGRAPEWVDAERDTHPIWVNETFARTYLDNKAVGERIELEDTRMEIVGVVGDIRSFGLQEDVRPFAYVALGNPAVSLDLMQVVVRTSTTPGSITSALRAAVDRVDASVPVTTVQTMTDVVASSLAQTWFTMILLACAAGGALVLGMIGLYGVIRYVVAQRTAEIGLRIALGARPGDVRAMVLWQGLSVTLAGVIVGLVAAWASTRLMASLLFEVSPNDPMTFITVPLALVAVSVIATYLPARRAALIDPSQALRDEG
ncbi:MAG TPA: ABC transporter permease, partial [Vicinamibacterales bacterium]|nr:ABC transporter permease [Vicinamibacterales bacterium]